MNLLQKLLGNYTGIPNAMLVNVLCKYNLPQREMRIFFALARCTWGWLRKGTYMTQRELAELTGIDPRNMSKLLKSMVEKCIIVTRNGKLKTYYEINRDYMTWRLPERDGLFTEALKLSTNSKTGTPPGAVSRDGSTDVPVPSVGTAKPAVCRDGMDWQETPSSAAFVASVKKLLKKSL